MRKIFTELFELPDKELEMFNAIYINLKTLKPMLFDKSIQTAIIAIKIAKELNLINNDFKIAALAANLGLQASDSYIEKNSFLNEQELNQIRRHPTLSSEILHRLGYKKSAEIVYYHHEFPNSKGYYKIMKYPLESDIINISDTFQGCVYNKTHKVPLTLNEALETTFSEYKQTSKINKEQLSLIDSILREMYDEIFENIY